MNFTLENKLLIERAVFTLSNRTLRLNQILNAVCILFIIQLIVYSNIYRSD